MKDSKLYTIIDSLKGNQLNLLEKSLKDDKRKSLYLLFQLLKKSGTLNIDREALFYKLFKKKYTTENDYVLRNEMRLLVEKIESILIKEQLENLFEKDKIFQLRQQLLLYKSLELFEFYEETWKQAKAFALEQYQYQTILELNAEYFEFVQFHIRNYKVRMEIYEQLLDENLLYTNYHLAQQYAYNSFLEGNTQKLRIEYQVAKNLKIPESSVTIRLTEFSSYLNQYYSLLGTWFPQQGTGKTELLLQALEALEKCNRNAAIFKQEYQRVLYLIATDYSMSAAFEKADIYFDRFFKEIPDSQLQNKAYYIFNYAVNLTKLNQYEKTLLIISEAEKHIKTSNDFLKDKYTLLKVICYLFTKNADQLKKLIPTDFSVLLPEQRVYFRFVNSIYYIINKEFVLAAEEINNLLRSKLLTEIDIHFLSVAKFYKNVLSLILEENTLDLSDKSLEKIKKEAFNIDTNEQSVIVNYMPYKWIKSALKI